MAEDDGDKPIEYVGEPTKPERSRHLQIWPDEDFLLSIMDPTDPFAMLGCLAAVTLVLIAVLAALRLLHVWS